MSRKPGAVQAKVQKLIEAYKKIKIELIFLRKECDCSANGLDCLQQENAKIKMLMQNMTEDEKVDVASLLSNVSDLEKENKLYKIKCENQDRLLKDLKKNEQKLINAIRSRQIL